jgi:uncharacterized protein
MKRTIEEKRKILESRLVEYRQLAIAFSGGVDSTYLLAVAVKALGKAHVLAITAHTSLVAEIERQDAHRLAAELDVNHIVLEPDVMDNKELIANSPDRCYICKKDIFGEIVEKAASMGFSTVAHGANRDDLKDYRPGSAAAEELGVCAPLADCDLGKDEIREMSREIGLATWKKPAMACLASRIPYGEEITETKLRRIEDAEQVIRDTGIRQCRVRSHGDLARVEVAPDDMPLLLGDRIRQRITEKLRTIGFMYVSLDLEGYGTGRLNRAIAREESSKMLKK